MTAPRIPLFQRKGAAGSSGGSGGSQTSNSSSGGKPGAQELDAGPAPATGEDGDADMVTCPACGCQFDPDAAQDAAEGSQGSQGAPPMDDGAGGDLGAKIAAMMGGGSQGATQ